MSEPRKEPLARKQYSDLPETYVAHDTQLPEPYASPNEALEVVRASEEKEVTRTREDDAPELLGQNNRREDHGSSRHKRRRKLVLMVITAVLVLLAIALGAGLGVGIAGSK